MARTKVKELPSKIQHLPAYKAPDPERIRHSDVWERATRRWKPGTRVLVEFKK